MKAIIINTYGGSDQLRLGTWETPTPSANEILVAVKATALNRADILQRQGKYPPPKGESPILGLEMSGVVAAVGTAVTRWQVGDTVCGLLAGGGYAQFVVIHEDLVMKIPVGMSFEEAAAIPEVFLTAFQALHWLGELKLGEKILIHAGASGVGTAAIQLAKLQNAEVFVTASKSKHQACYDLGADHVIDYKTENFETVIKEKTNGQGVDVLIDFLAAPYFQQNLNVMNMDGRMIMLALMGGVIVENLNLMNILLKRIQIKGTTLRARSLDYKIALVKDFETTIWENFASKELKPIVDSVFDWVNVSLAHDKMENNQNTGKIVLSIGR